MRPFLVLSTLGVPGLAWAGTILVPADESTIGDAVAARFSGLYAIVGVKA